MTERVINRNIGPTWSRNGEYLAYYSFRNVTADTSSRVLVVRTEKTRSGADYFRISGHFLAIRFIAVCRDVTRSRDTMA